MPEQDAPVRVGIAGLGRSGWDIHARALTQMPAQYKLVAVSDLAQARREEAVAKFECRPHDDLESLAADRDVELLVVATPSHLHVEHAIRALKAGKHVVCEKPMATSVKEADRVIAASRRTGRVLAPFQNLRYCADFVKVRKVIQSGKLGQIVLIRMAWQRFNRRWDWQTLREFKGGSLNNTGPHPLDQALQFITKEKPEIFCDLLRTPLSAGDAEDHCKVVLRAPGEPTIDIEVTSACAYPDDRWHVMGTRGGLKGSGTALRWKYVKDYDSLPPRPVDRNPTIDRSYNHETLEWTEETWEIPPEQPSEVTLFYADLYKTLRGELPLVVTPESVRRQIAILEHCHKVCRI